MGMWERWFYFFPTILVQSITPIITKEKAKLIQHFFLEVLPWKDFFFKQRWKIY